jgi:anti-sigma regulatory factor (Ser/Thr protein kinase)
MTPKIITAPRDNGSNVETLATFSIPSQLGNERMAVEMVLKAVVGLHLTDTRLHQLGTAVAETCMNAIEHGNQENPEIPVQIQVLVSKEQLNVRIIDQGGYQEIHEYTAPDLDAKLAGLQSPRGWGLFLIENMVDELHVSNNGKEHIFELIFNLREADRGT